MFDLSRALHEFHAKHGFPSGLSLADQSDLSSDFVLDDIGCRLLNIASDMKTQAIKVQKEENDHRLYRVHLMIEELAEAIRALSVRDNLELADGLGDLMYVVEGTADTFSIPMPEVTAEIHRSNMSKAVRDPNADPRMRNKGPNYSPPDIVKAIDEGMARLRWEKQLLANEELSLEFQKGIERSIVEGLKERVLPPEEIEARASADHENRVNRKMEDFAADGLPPANNDGDPLYGVV